MFYNDTNIFLSSEIKTFDFIKWSDLSYDSDNSLLKFCLSMIVYTIY